MRFRRRVRGVCLMVVVSACGEAGAEPTEHPRLFFGPADVVGLGERAEREPHATFYRNMKKVLDAGVKLPNAELDRPMMASQLGALVYTVTGDTAYAERAKPEYVARVRSWASDIPVYDPAKRKGRISLFVSRRLQSLCTEFDLLSPAGVFSEEEVARTRDTLAMVVARLMERGDSFNPYDYYDERFRVDNWNTDRIMAVGMFALTFPEHPPAAAWRDHAVQELAWQLEHALLPDGTWPEGTRYQGAVLRSVIPFAYALKRNGGRDFFAHPRLRGLLDTLIHLQTPRVAAAGGAALLPGAADANWESIWEAVLGWSAGAYAHRDPAFAGRLMWAWQRAGSPFTVEFSPGNPIMGFLLIDPQVEAIPQADLASERLAGGGALLRDGFGTDDAWYVHFSVGTPRGYWQHQHRDRGSFSLFGFNTPLALDPGVYSYGDSLAKWYVRSRAHNQVVFNKNDAREGGTIDDVWFGNRIDYVFADLTKSVGTGYERHLFFIKPHFLLIWDHIRGDASAVYHLHVLVDDSVEDPVKTASNVVSFACLGGVDPDVHVLFPPGIVGSDRVEVADDPYPLRFFAERNSVPTMVGAHTPKWLRLHQGHPGQDFITILHPRRKGSAPLRVVRFEPGRQPNEPAEAHRQVSVHDAAFESQPGTEDSSVAEIEIGRLQATVYLGPQRREHVQLDGRAAVVLRDATGTDETVLLASARRFRSDGGHDVRWDKPATRTIRCAGASSRPVVRVQPIDWSRFGAAPPPNADLRQCRALLLNCARYNLGWITKTFDPDASRRGYVLTRMDEHGIRPACSVVYALATALKTSAYDAAVAGVSPRKARSRTIALLRSTLATHKANREGGKPAWGDSWQSALWAALAGFGGWMLWDDLDSSVHAQLRRVVVHEADRFIDYEVPYWNGAGGDTKAEENAWNAMILNLAVAMMPEQEHARAWKRKCSELMVSAYATEDDQRKNTTILDGRPVKEWLNGYNALRGGVVVNHGFIHPDYMVAQTMNLWAYTTQSLAGRPVPETADFNGALIYHTLVTKDWPAPPYDPPGGTIYQMGKAAVYYPNGSDWSTHDLSLYYLIDVWAHILGWDHALPHRAETWMRTHGQKMLAMQRRRPDRKMFAKGEYDTYPGAEQLVA